jgi:hypothetical protein
MQRKLLWERMMNLHQEIMNIPTIKGTYADEYCYKLGHRDARHAAAELSLKAEARIEELEEELKKTKELADYWCDRLCEKVNTPTRVIEPY